MHTINSHVQTLCVCLSLLFLQACATPCSTNTPNACPFYPEEIAIFPHAVQSADLDGDGKDEFIGHITHGPEKGQAIAIINHEGMIVGQANFASPIMRAHFVDYDGDQKLEILVPIVRNDSLFVSIVDRYGQKLKHFFLIDGQPRIEEGEEMEWDAAIRELYQSDLDNDGNDELITLIYTGYSRMPRGVLVNRLETGERIGSYLIGAFPINSHFGDFDGNGLQQLVISTWAPDNGARANGFDDQHSYILDIEFSPTPYLKQSREMGGLGSSAFTAFDTNAQEFLIHSYGNTGRYTESTFEYLNPETWLSERKKTFNEAFAETQVINVDQEGNSVIAMLHLPDKIKIIDHDFEELNSKIVGQKLGSLRVAPDIDGDGAEELLAFSSDFTMYILDNNLETNAVYNKLTNIQPPQLKLVEFINRGPGSYPAFSLWDENKSVVLSLTPQKFYWFYRYRDLIISLSFLVTGLLMYLTFGGRIHKKSPAQKSLDDKSPKNTIINSPFYSQVNTAISQNLNDPSFGPRQLANLMHVSLRTLQRRFKVETNTTAILYIRKKRIERAVELVKTQDLNISQIADMVGFSDPAYFGKVFKEEMGCAPQEFKAKNNGPNDLE